MSGKPHLLATNVSRGFRVVAINGPTGKFSSPTQCLLNPLPGKFAALNKGLDRGDRDLRFLRRE